MNNEYYGVATTPNDDFIAHYGIKGMKWGVRKALASGNEKAMRRQWNKAVKKLNKLEKLGESGKKYAKRAAAYGAGAAAAGGLAAAGTSGVARGIKAIGRGAGAAGRFANLNLRKAGHGGLGAKALNAGNQVNKSMHMAGRAVDQWGNQRSHAVVDAYNKVFNKDVGYGKSVVPTNNTLVRLGAGAVGVGLGAAAAKNAYRAATAKRNKAKAQQFRSEMKKAFAGTQYANANPTTRAPRKKRRNSSRA